MVLDTHVGGTAQRHLSGSARAALPAQPPAPHACCRLRARLSCALSWLGTVNCLTRIRPRSPSRQAVSADPSQQGRARSHRCSRNILVRNILAYQQYEDGRWRLPRRLPRVPGGGCRRVARFLLPPEPSACHGILLPRMEPRASALAPATVGRGHRRARRRGTRPRACSFGQMLPTPWGKEGEPGWIVRGIRRST
jgi:hypothetical protein